MEKQEFLKDVSYAIDRMRGKMTVFYKNKPLKTILLHKNMSYNSQNEELAHQIALESDLAKRLNKRRIMKTFNKEVEDCIQKSRYNEAAELVAQKLGLEWTINFLKNDKHFEDDKDVRDIYKITLSRGNRKYSFNFGQSINNSGFYAQYGRTKYNIPIGLLTKTDAEVKRYVKLNLQYDFGNVKNDKIVRPVSPDLYSILACLQKYDVGSFEDFCSEFGYDEDSRKAYNTYTAVKEEYMNMCSLFNDEELELLNLIN